MDEFNRNQNMNKDNMILFFSQVQTFNTDSHRMCHPIHGTRTRKKLNIITLGKKFHLSWILFVFNDYQMKTDPVEDEGFSWREPTPKWVC